MKCRLPNVHQLFLCIGFSFSGCYSSQQLSQNNILLTTIKFKTFQDYFVKLKDFKALNLVQSNLKLYKTFKAAYGPCISETPTLTVVDVSECLFTRPRCRAEHAYAGARCYGNSPAIW